MKVFVAAPRWAAGLFLALLLCVPMSSPVAADGLTLLSEGFSASMTSANQWLGFGDACLTAGTSATPATSLPACRDDAPQDAVGQGALQLTTGAAWQAGMVIAKTPLPTANGLQVTFTDYAFDGTTPGADGLALFFIDASQPLPTRPAASGEALGYAGNAAVPGLANAYVGIAFDEYGNFSRPVGKTGGPGVVPETIAVRGAATTLWQYLGGATGGTGQASSLPFTLDQPQLTTRPVNAPTIRATLTAAGLLTVAIDRHDGAGFVRRYGESIVGVAGQRAVPANVYVGLSAATGKFANAHQVTGLVASAMTAVPAGVALQSESFSAPTSSANTWLGFGDACLTAGNAPAPATSLPACGTSAPHDASGAGALQLTAAGPKRAGTVVSRQALSTANGLQITFTDAAFNGTSPGADGLAFFLTDAAKPLPTSPASAGGALGYAGAFAVPGLAGAYLGIGLDEDGNFSNPADGRNGGPGRIGETIAVRGSAATNWQYLGGATNAGGQAATLPFAWDLPSLVSRPATAPSIRAILTPSGVLSVAVDRHDGAGFANYYSQSIVGVGGQPAVPAYVHVGLSAATGALWNRHQITNLVISSANLPPVVNALQNPPQLVSTNGSLVFNVSAAFNAATGKPQFVYNGSTVPPTLRVLPGDTLVVNLTNNLPVPAAGADYANPTNLHFHGLHVSPLAPGDDSIDMLAAPGQSLHYVVHIPVNHPPGLYWYHAHAHAEAERQTLAGMSGALIVDGIAAYTPQIANMTERVLIVRDAPLAGGALPDANVAALDAMKWAMLHTGLHASSTQQSRNPYVQVDPNYRRFVRPQTTSTHCIAGNPEAALKALTLNGQAQPAIPIAPGEKQFWRLVNAGADTYLDVQVDNTQMQIIGLDGVPLASGIGTPASMSVSHWVVPPASRVEFIVTGPPAGKTASLRTNCFDAGLAGDAMPATVLAAINPAASTPAVTAATQRASRFAARVSPLAKRFVFHTAPSAAIIRAAAVTATRTIYYSDQNTINGIAYDPAAPPAFYAQSGTVEEWTIVNNSDQVHTFHIHQVHFLVEAINGATQPQQNVLDNVNVPAESASGPGTVKIRLDFTDPTIIGTFLLHCHILAHEDAGMMAKIRIGTAPPLRLSAANLTFARPTAALQTVTVTGGTAPYSVTGCSGVANAAVTGAVVSVLPAGAGACVLTIADASNPSITSTLTIQVDAGPATITLDPAVVSFASPTAAAQNVTVIGGTAPYTLTGCNGIVSARLNGLILGVTPAAVGTCSLVIADAAANTVTLPVAVNTPLISNLLDALTFHQNALRTGWDQNETALTPASVASSAFGQLGTLTAPAGMRGLGKVYAQPLFATGELAGDGRQHNLIVVATANAQVYAFDESTRAVVWHRDFIAGLAGVRQQVWTDTGCADVSPDDGIIGTPVIDRARDAIYVVVATVENGVPFTRLHAIALGSGNDLLAPTVITGSVAMTTGGIASISSLGNMNRSALLEANGNIYVALGSHCDQNSATVHGWMIAYSAATLAETGNLVDLANANAGSGFYLSSIWMAGYGPAADAAGNIYFATGNGPFNGTSNFGMSILKVPGNLSLAASSSFTPIQEATDSGADGDLGSGGVMLLPDQPGAIPHIMFGGGKCSTGTVGCLKYLLNRDAPGGQRAGNAGALWAGNVGGALIGGPAYFADANGGQHVVFGTGAPISTYTLGLGPASLALQSSAYLGCLGCRDAGSQPVVSSNGTRSGTAIVWALKTPGNSGGALSLYAFNALAMSSVLYTGPAGTWSQAPGTSYIGGALISPLVANGHVYVPGDGAITVFGLR